MDGDQRIQEQIETLVDEEHALLKAGEEQEGLSSEQHARLQAVKVELDRYWDLLRQRRARRRAGEDPEGASPRDADTVELRPNIVYSNALGQEWPLAGQKHQLSYTVPLAHTDDPLLNDTGIGDIALNYRYQIGGGEGAAEGWSSGDPSVVHPDRRSVELTNAIVWVSRRIWRARTSTARL